MTHKEKFKYWMENLSPVDKEYFKVNPGMMDIRYYSKKSIDSIYKSLLAKSNI